MTSTRPLYGGAISSSLPSAFLDASDLRQVPDTQEVFLSPNSDLSLIIEVLELVKDEGAGDSLEAAIKFHFSSLAHDNSALSSNIDSINVPTIDKSTNGDSTRPEVQGPTVLTGTQSVSKFNKSPEEADTVLIQFALWRIPSKNADVTLCVNFPVKMGETGVELDPQEAKRVFEDAVRSFEIRDFGLFAG
ncbi:hypothetical protein JCM16303_000556 [Sporobolomyces ruberrimus]